MENLTNFKDYVKYIFHSFIQTNCREGQGGFFLRNWNFDRVITPQQRMHVYEVLNVLMQCGYIAAKDSTSMPFLVLTNTGYDYTQGAGISLGNLDLNQICDGDDLLENVWSLVGVKDDAPFYIDDEELFSVLEETIGESTTPFNEYLMDRKQNGLDISRRMWYKDLFSSIPVDKNSALLTNLSRKISKIYSF